MKRRATDDGFCSGSRVDSLIPNVTAKWPLYADVSVSFANAHIDNRDEREMIAHSHILSRTLDQAF